jgi:hypothetical protein
MRAVWAMRPHERFDSLASYVIIGEGGGLNISSGHGSLLSFSGLSLIKELRRPIRRFGAVLFVALPASEPPRHVDVACLPRIVCRSFCLHFGFLRSREASEGLAPFRSRTFGRHVSDLAAASLKGGNRGSVASSGLGPGPRAKTGRSIRCPARIRPLQKARSGSSLRPADGRQPFMPASVSRPLPFESCPFGFAMRGGCGRFPSGAFRRLSSSDTL